MTSQLRTPRLVLRQWCEADLDDWAQMNADPRVREFSGGLLSREQAAVALCRFRDELRVRGWGWWAVEVADSGVLAGTAGLNPIEASMPFEGVEIGWRLARWAWGNGYATEAARAIVEYAFGTLGLREVVATAAARNVRSRAVMRRIGMTRDPAEDYDHLAVPPGPLRRSVLYRLRNPAC